MADLSALTPVSPLNAPLSGAGNATAAPTMHESAAFAQAVANTAPVEQTTAPLPTQAPAEALTQTLNNGFDAFAKRVQTAGQSGEMPLPESVALDGRNGEVKQVIDNAMQSMQSAYAFAIETTMASRGSTETTKIFNTLLKGQ